MAERCEHGRAFILSAETENECLDLLIRYQPDFDDPATLLGSIAQAVVRQFWEDVATCGNCNTGTDRNVREKLSRMYGGMFLKGYAMAVDAMRDWAELFGTEVTRPAILKCADMVEDAKPNLDGAGVDD